MSIAPRETLHKPAWKQYDRGARAAAKSMRRQFQKMHGLGNDFVVFHVEADEPLPPPVRIRELADRRRGIGFDQVLWVTPDADTGIAAAYRIANADGDEVGQCGNGARCIAMSLADRGVASPMRLRSPAGIVEASVDGREVSVAMGEPLTEPPEVPFIGDAAGPPYRIGVVDQTVEVYVVSVGNPHAVIVVDDIATAPVDRIGGALQQHPAFPDKVNVGFLEITGRDSVSLRVFERGVGETLACGTGACAAAVAARHLGLSVDPLRLTLPGGELMVSWRGGRGPVWLRGPAETSFEGTVRI